MPAGSCNTWMPSVTTPCGPRSTGSVFAQAGEPMPSSTSGPEVAAEQRRSVIAHGPPEFADALAAALRETALTPKRGSSLPDPW